MKRSINGERQAYIYCDSSHYSSFSQLAYRLPEYKASSSSEKYYTDE